MVRWRSQWEVERCLTISQDRIWSGPQSDIIITTLEQQISRVLESPPQTKRIWKLSSVLHAHWLRYSEG